MLNIKDLYSQFSVKHDIILLVVFLRNQDHIHQHSFLVLTTVWRWKCESFSYNINQLLSAPWRRLHMLVERGWKNIYTGCPRGTVPDFGTMYLTLKYTDITQNTYVYPKLKGYGDNGERSLKVWQLLHNYWLINTY